MLEEWRPTYHPDYDVSNLGRVRSRAPQGGDMRNRTTGPSRPKTPRILKPGRSSSGYWSVSFGREHGSQSTHVLVATAFLGPCPKGQEVRHKDDDRSNSRWDNLEYGTRTQNILDAVERGRFRGRFKTLSVGEVKEIRHRYSKGETQSSLAKHFDVYARLIWGIVHGRTRQDV